MASADAVGLLGLMALLGGLGSVAERLNVLMDCFQVVQTVVVSCNDMVDSVGSWLLADVADSFVTLQDDKASC